MIRWTHCAICSTPGQLWCYWCQRHIQQYTWHIHTQDTDHLDGIVIARTYNRMVRHLIHHIKYKKSKTLISMIWNKLATLTLTHPLYDLIQHHSSTTAITYVPSHRFKHYCIKWYNQSQLLAQAYAQSLQIKCIKLLRKSRRTTSQVHVQQRTKRLHNIQHSFRGDSHSSQYSLIIIVDDVITTGATLNECARTIRQHYPNSIIWWVCISRNSSTKH